MFLSPGVFVTAPPSLPLSFPEEAYSHPSRPSDAHPAALQVVKDKG